MISAVFDAKKIAPNLWLVIGTLIFELQIQFWFGTKKFTQMLKVLRQETLKLLPMDTALQRSDEALKAMEASMGTHQVTM